jgi:outer membrane protein assembly factor BamA
MLLSRKKMTLIFLSLFALQAQRLVAEEEFTINGNERTQNVYIKRLMEQCFHIHGKDATDDILSQCLMNSNLFSEARVKRDQGKLNVTVKDKWTLIPVPAFSAGSGDTKSAGIFLFESNFLGIGMNLGVGAITSNKGDTYFGMLGDPSLFFTNWNYNITLSKKSQEVVLKDDDKEIFGFQEEMMAYKVNLGYKYLRWNVSVFGSMSRYEYSDFDGYTFPKDNNVPRAGLGLGYDNRNNRLYFAEGLSLNLRYEKDLDRTDKERLASQITFDANWQQALFSDQVLQLAYSQALLEGGTYADSFRVSGKGFRGIEGATEWAERYYVGSIDYQIPLASFDSGTLTTAPFVDVGKLYQRYDDGEAVDFVSSGIGIYYYLKKIALPGVGFIVGYNEKYQGQFFTVTVGFAK